MHGTARNLDADENDNATDLSETVFHEPGSSAREGRDRPDTGSDAMPAAARNAQANGRYTFTTGARPLDGYTVRRAIGRGGFGEVYYATSDSGKEVALKLVIRNLDVERRGVSQCMNLKCPNLVTVYDLKGNDAGETFVIMEYVSGPSLANVLAQHPNGLPPAEALGWLKGLVEGVAYLHDHGIVHRDLKPANLFMEDGVVKIGDYGLAKLIAPNGGGTEHSESIGTCHYMAPEIASGKYNKPIDIYAMGVIMFEMLTGRVPFEGESVGEVLMKHLTARPDVSPVPEPYRGIVARALAKDPNHRPPRVHDLLPPEAAPKPAGVRFIGDGKAGPKAKDDVLVIGAEEPVFYIGPGTTPNNDAVAARLRANWEKVRQNRAAQARRRQEAQARRASFQEGTPRQAPAAAPTPVPPPEPPVMPAARVRVAELASSMLWAAPVAGLLTVPAAMALGVEPTAAPDRLAFLFGTSLIGTWAALASAKLVEGRAAFRAGRRALSLGTGATVGLLAAALWAVVGVGALDAPFIRVGQIHPDLVEFTGTPGHPTPLVFALYFGLLGLLTGPSGLASRERRRRFRIWPVAKAAGFGALLGLAVPFPEPWGLAVAAVTAATVQAVSPWSEAASRYAKYVAKNAKKARKQARRQVA